MADIVMKIVPVHGQLFRQVKIPMPGAALIH